MKLVVRPAAHGDAERIHELIDAHTFREDGSGYLIPVDTEEIRSIADDGRFFVADDDGSLAGCASVLDYNGIAELRSFVVAREYRERGVGRALLEYGKQRAAEAGHEVLYALVNKEALGVFESNGFEPAAYRPLEKLQRDCIRCPLYKRGCREQTVVFRLPSNGNR
ncbi:MAG: GNAT family N-acetyltransferase [Candidatus Aenigmarchaeota archaeon]|nr:GNAT family N-acetyltransferase [Candidatus Aenigmarchaeota archaeon]